MTKSTRSVGAGTKRKPKQADPGTVLLKGAAIGEIARRLADGEAATVDEAAYAPSQPKKRRKAAAAPIANANGALLCGSGSFNVEGCTLYLRGSEILHTRVSMKSNVGSGYFNLEGLRSSKLESASN